MNNLQEIIDQYQELLIYLMQGKGTLIPANMIDNNRNQLIFSAMIEQFWANPEKFYKINVEYAEKLRDLIGNSLTKFMGNPAKPAFYPQNKDKRFADSSWQENAYFDFVKQYYLMSSEWLQENIAQYKLSAELQQYLEFITKQFIDAFAPSNFVFCNPQVLRETLDSGGANLVQGLKNFLRDIRSSKDILNIETTDTSAFKFGENIATTPGKIIFQNKLVQLICYKPKEQTHSVPIFIIPPCINKYYILDLSPHNSLVSYLVQNHFQVFLISWVNPDDNMTEKDFAAYLEEGLLEPCFHILKLGYKKIDFVGYCIGGVFLAIILSYLKSKKLDHVNSATFFTTLLDYSNPGDLSVLINKSTINHIEDDMQQKGYFDGRYLSNSFSLLRANDLVWSFFVSNYLLGKSPMPFDLLYWNADSTHLSAKMFSYYLNNMYINNLLREPGFLNLLNTPIDLSNIDCNSFFVAAKDDHIAPWSSVYEGMKLLNGNKVFCLTDSGHISGIVNSPKSSKYSYRAYDDLTLDSKEWFIKATEYKGSWWEKWLKWLNDNDKIGLVKSINYKNLKALEMAPGSYVKKRI